MLQIASDLVEQLLAGPVLTQEVPVQRATNARQSGKTLRQAAQPLFGMGPEGGHPAGSTGRIGSDTRCFVLIVIRCSHFA